MIQTHKQRRIANNQIAKLREALMLSKEYPGDMDERLYKAMIAGIESQIKDIQREVDEFNKPKAL